MTVRERILLATLIALILSGLLFVALNVALPVGFVAPFLPLIVVIKRGWSAALVPFALMTLAVLAFAALGIDSEYEIVFRGFATFTWIYIGLVLVSLGTAATIDQLFFAPRRD